MGNPVRIRPKYKTESEWLSLNPVLRQGGWYSPYYQMRY